MGTRGAYGFYKDGMDKITYNNFDSFPDDLGLDIIKYIKSKTIEEMNNDFNVITMVRGSDKPTTEQFLQCAEYYNDTVSNKSPEDWYCVLREAQGDLNASAKVGFMIDSSKFLQNSLFCEWAYIINLDTNKLEVYEGFQEERTETRYQPENANNSGYWGCKLVKELELDKTIEKKFNKFVQKVKKENRE
jgi:hypothetical protein